MRILRGRDGALMRALLRRTRALRAFVPLLALSVLALSALAFTGCAQVPDEATPNVVVVLIDTLRADWLEPYGRDESTSPNIREFARHSAVFEQASAAAPWTLPSVVSLFTSTLLIEHGVTLDGQSLNPEFRTLAETLRERGYTTASFISNAYAGKISGLDRGFDTLVRLGSPDLGIAIRKWIHGAPEPPFFLYAHNAQPHEPTNATDESRLEFEEVPRKTVTAIRRATTRLRALMRADFKQKLPLGATQNGNEQYAALLTLTHWVAEVERLYSAAVLDADRFVGATIEALKASGAWEETVFILISDHGEEFGEHQGWLHDQSVYEELLHVPLLIRFPGDRHAGLRVATPVSILDVLPTLSELLGKRDFPTSMRGHSLLPILEGDDSDFDGLRVMAVRHNRKKYTRAWKQQRGDLNVALRDGSWKGIYNAEIGSIELYDLATDPAEQNDRSADQPARAKAMRRAAVQALMAKGKTRAKPVSAGGYEALTQEQLGALRELGYVDR